MKRLTMTAAGAFALAMAAQIVLAADIPTKAPAYKASVAAPMFNWSGFYVGGQAGYGWGKSEHFDLAFSYGDFSINGAAIGGTMGFNWHVSPSWILGIEADINWSNIRGEYNPGFCTCITELDWFGTARIRSGVVNGQSLLYVTGGVAYGKFYAYSNIPDNGTLKRMGWTAGAGLEQSFAPNWSAKVEYLYVDFGQFTYDNSPAVDDYSAKAHLHLVRFGLNYRFASGKDPVIANY